MMFHQTKHIFFSGTIPTLETLNQERQNIMDLLMKTAGLSHISKKILKGLNFKSLSSCRLVCKSMNILIEDCASKLTFEDLQVIYENFTRARSITGPEKELRNSFFTKIFKHSNLGSESNIFINLYLNHVFTRPTRFKPTRVNYLKQSPIFEFVYFGNARMVEYILVSGVYKYDNFVIQSDQNWTLVHEAASLGHSEVLKCLRDFIPPTLTQMIKDNTNENGKLMLSIIWK